MTVPKSGISRALENQFENRWLTINKLFARLPCVKANRMPKLLMSGIAPHSESGNAIPAPP